MLRFTSIIALFSVVYLVFIVIYYAFNYKDIPGDSHFPSSTITPELWGAVISFDLFKSLPVFVLGFGCHPNVRSALARTRAQCNRTSRLAPCGDTLT